MAGLLAGSAVDTHLGDYASGGAVKGHEVVGIFRTGELLDLSPAPAVLLWICRVAAV